MLTTAWLISFQFQHNSTQLMCTCVSLTEESEEGRWVDCRGYWPVHHGVLSALYAGHTAEGINSSNVAYYIEQLGFKIIFKPENKF